MDVKVECSQEDLKRCLVFVFSLCKKSIDKLIHGEELSFEDKVLVCLYNLFLSIYHLHMVVSMFRGEGEKEGGVASYFT